MRISLNRRDSPANVIDIYPETFEDGQMIIDFLSNFASVSDIPRTAITVLMPDGSRVSPFSLKPGDITIQDVRGIIISVE